MNSKLIELLVKVRDASQTIADATNEYIETMAPPNATENTSQAKTYDANKIKWEQAEGASGPYERSEEVNSLDFKALLQDLAAHQGKLTRDGYFYWTFKNGSTIGRKKKTTNTP
jgi:hypothetical protein